MLSHMKRGKGFYKNLVSLAVPIILQNLIMTSLGLVDTFMVGLLGEAPMAAVTVANTPIFVVLLLIFGLQSGSAVLISQFWGKQDTESINRVVGIGLYIAGILTTIFALVMWLVPEQAMAIFCNDPELIRISASYIRIVGFSYIFNGLTSIYTGAHRGMENPKLGLYIYSASMLANTFMNWVLIFGNLGAPALGVEGAAIATLLSRVLEFIIMVVYAKRNKRFKLKLQLIVNPGRAMLSKFVKYASPVVVNETLWGLGSAIYPTIMGHMENSVAILAAFTIAGNIEKVCTVAVFAVASTAAIIVGREIGKGNAEEAYSVGGTLCTVAFGMGLLTAGVMIILIYTVVAPYVYPLFGLSPLSGEIATMMQLITFCVLPLRAFNSTTIVGVLRGGGDSKVASVIDTAPMWLIAIPFAAIFGLVLNMGIFWVYIAISIDGLVKFVFGLRRFRSKKWIHDVTRLAG